MRNHAERVDDPTATIRSVSITDHEIVAEMGDGRKITAPLSWYPRLLYGTPRERDNWRLIARGHGVHWPDLDEDLSGWNVVLGQASGESQQSFRRWLECRAERASQEELDEAITRLPHMEP